MNKLHIKKIILIRDFNVKIGNKIIKRIENIFNEEIMNENGDQLIYLRAIDKQYLLSIQHNVIQVYI